MKVLLIKPPNIAFYHEIERFYPVGLAYLASAAREAGHTVHIFDSLIHTEDNRVLNENELSEGQKYKKNHHPRWKNLIRWGASYERIIDVMVSFKPDVVAITAMHTPMYDTAYKVAEIVKNIQRDIKVILGGSHGSIAFEHVMNKSKIDFVLQGEGEGSFVELLNCIEKNKEPVDVDGVVYRKYNCIDENYYYREEGEFNLHINEKKNWIENLDEISFPAADLLEIDKYDRVTIITSRGCPFSCNFCTVHPTVGRKHRYRSTENVVAEIDYYIKEFGVENFNIEDDNFTYNFERANRILDKLIERGYNISFNLPNGITAINVNEEFIKKLIKLNIQDSFIGLETTSDERLKKINKTFTSVDKVEEIIGWFKKNNSKMGVSLVVGFPDQTIDEMIEDITELIKRQIEFGTANPCYPIPKSTLYNECISEGLISENMDYTFFDEFNFPIETKKFKRKDIYDIWICSMVYNYYPEMLEIMKRGFGSSDELARLYNGNGYGKIQKINDEFYCIPSEKDSFTEKMKLSNHISHSNIFVETITEDILSNLFILFTGKNYTAYQISTNLVPNSTTAFWIKENDEDISEVKGKFINAIHNYAN